MRYKIMCLENAPLSSWNELYTEKELQLKFRDYALNEWNEVPELEKFTLDFIADMWNIRFEKIGVENE